MYTVDLVVRGGKIVSSAGVKEGCLVVDKGVIKDIIRIPPKADKVIDAGGNFILPGLVDVHVHFREPGASSKEDWLTGSSAAAAGGYTTVIDMPNTQPPATTVKLLSQKREIAASKSIIDYGFHFGAAPDNISEIKAVENVAGVKFYLSSAKAPLLIENDFVIYEEFKALREKNLPAVVHAETEQMVEYLKGRFRSAGREDPAIHSEVRCNICAADAVNRIIFLSKAAGNRLHICHVSTREELALIRGVRDRRKSRVVDVEFKKLTLKASLNIGKAISASDAESKRLTVEATPHHLFLTKQDYASLGNYGKTNPPLRSEEDRKELWEAVFDGTIDLIATDHAPHTREDKDKSVYDASSGVPGLETALPLMLNELNQSRKITLNRIVWLMSENPARVFGIKGKGRLEPGFDADFTIVDLKEEKTVNEDRLFTKCGWSPFRGWKLKGWPVKTFMRGQLVFDGNEVNKKNKGKEVSYH